MFFTFLSKENVYGVDMEVLRKYPPEKVLFYFYSAKLTLGVRTCAELLLMIEANQASKNLRKWHQLLEDSELLSDFNQFENNDFLTIVGPYYYPNTNTRIYLTKDYIPSNNTLTIEDMKILSELQDPPKSNKDLQTYYKNRRNSKKLSKNKEDLIKDIDMCIKAFQETEVLNKHINYINKFLEARLAIVENTNLQPEKPDNVPEKPLNNLDGYIKSDNIIPFSRLRLGKKQEKPNNSSFNYDTKVYFIKYREYEKACDRYKNLLNAWVDFHSSYLDKCYQDIDEAEDKLKKSNTYLEVLNTIILRSYVHPDYQDVVVLEKFLHFLTTGRAEDLQECMNIFEEEKCWLDIKASQHRIENTIYFLQSETDLTRFADENLSQYLQQFNETAASLDRSNSL